MHHIMILECLLFILIVPDYGLSTTSTSGSVGDRCTTPTDEAGECRNLKNCSVLLELANEKGKENSTALLNESRCGFEGLESLVCCPELQNRWAFWNSYQNRGGNRRRNPTAGGVSHQFPVQSGTGGGGGNIARQQCGKNTILSVTDKIVGGTSASLGEWPWMAALGYRTSTSSGLQWFCGGSLVNNRHVITAAHCVVIPQNTILSKVRLGDLNLDDDVPDGASPITMDVEQAIPHPSYRSSGKTDDIAIVRLRGAVQFTDNIKPICLPSTAYFRSGSLAGQQPYVVGWGALFSKGPKTNALQQVDVAITDEASCRSAYSTLSAAVIDNRVICAGKSGADACQGDSGGPLMLGQGNTYYLVGIVSYGQGCADPRYPGVYTRVSTFMNWINSNIN